MPIDVKAIYQFILAFAQPAIGKPSTEKGIDDDVMIDDHVSAKMTEILTEINLSM